MAHGLRSGSISYISFDTTERNAYLLLSPDAGVPAKHDAQEHTDVTECKCMNRSHRMFKLLHDLLPRGPTKELCYIKHVCVSVRAHTHTHAWHEWICAIKPPMFYAVN